MIINRKRTTKFVAIALIISLLFPIGCSGVVNAAEASPQPYHLNKGNYNLDDNGKPLVNNDYVKTDETLVYADGAEPNKDNYHPVEDSTVILPTYKLGMKVHYEIALKTLAEHGYSLTYQVPAGFAVPTTDMNLEIGGEIVGEVNCDSSGFVTFNYDRTKMSYTNVSYDLFINVPVNLDSIDKNTNKTTIVFGTFSKEIAFDPNYVIANIEIDIKKTNTGKVVEHEGAYYIPFTVKATAHNNCEKMYVVDFAHLKGSSQSCVEGYYDSNFNKITASPISADSTGQVYLGTVTNSKKPVKISSADTMVWEITDANPYTENTLTYYIKVKNEYPTHGQTEEVENTATVYTSFKDENYTDIYSRGDDDSSYVPTLSAEIRKTASADYLQIDENGDYYITYTITVKNTSGYDVDHFDVFDWMYANMYDSSYVEYIPDSFTINGESVPVDQVVVKDLDLNESYNYDKQMIIGKTYDTNENRWLYRYNLCAGKFKVDETKTVKYKLKIKPELLVTANDGNKFRNYADVRVHNSTVNLAYAEYYAQSLKQWTRKSHEQIPSDKTVNMTDGNIYNSSKVQVSTPTSFTAPANSYHYTVVVNEDGQFIMTKSNFNDAFVGKNMAYVGYVRVRAYDTLNKINLKASNMTNEITTKGTLVGTSYYQVGGEMSFTFTPEQLGIGGKYAYIVDYYAKQVTKISTTVTNNFSITGNVGYGSGAYDVSKNNLNVSDSVTLVGTQKCELVDKPYMYALPGDDMAYSDQAALYWVVKVTGDPIEGTKIYDIVNTGHNTLEDDWLVGVYKGSDSVTFDATKTLEQNVNVSGNSLNDFTSYTSGSVNNGKKYITLTDNPELEEGEALYMVVKTRFYFNLENYNNGVSGQFWTIKNEATYAYPNGAETGSASSTQILYRNKGLKKLVDGDTGVYRYDGTSWTMDKKDGTKVAIDMPAPQSGESGIYTAWNLYVNIDSVLTGAVTMVDTLPDGLVLDSLELTGIGSNLTTSTTIPQSQEPDWDRIGLKESDFNKSALINNNVKFSNGDKVMAGENYYYNSTSNKLVFGVKILTSAVTNNNVTDTRYATFRVLCKVTDSTNFTNNAESKTFTNKAMLYSNLGTTARSSDITFTSDSLSKEGDIEKAKRTGIYHFTINANPLGMDLVDGSDTVTVCDKLSGALTFKDKTVVIKKSSGAVLSADKYAVEVIPQDDGSTLVKFCIPDGMELAIEYDAKVTVPDGSASVAINNSAYWEGESPATDSIVDVPNFTPTPSGWGEGYTTKGTLNITVKDNSGNPIKNSKFQVSKVTVDNNNVSYTETVEVTSDNDGNIVVDNLDYNQVYSVKQITTPENYVIDEKPHYVAITNSYGSYSESYNDLLDTVYELADNGVTVECEYSSYETSTEFVNNVGRIRGATLYVGSRVGVNFYVDFGGEVVNNKSTLNTKLVKDFNMHLTMKDSTGKVLNNEVVDFDENEIRFSTVNGEMRPLYRFTHWSKAYEMADTIEATLYDGSIKINETPVTYSMVKYAENMIGKRPGGNDLLDEMLKGMLVFGEHAQKYWNHNLAKLASATEKLSDADRNISNITFDSYAPKKVQNIPTISTSSLELGVKEGLGYDVKIGLVADKTDITFSDLKSATLSSKTMSTAKKDNVEVSIAENNKLDLMTEIRNKDKKIIGYTITIEDLPVFRWEDEFTLELVDNSNRVYSVTFSLLSYGYGLGNSADVKLVNLLKSMAKFNQRAEAYFKNVGLT